MAQEESDTSTAKSKAAIIEHMNKLHSDTFSRFLGYYNRLPASRTIDARLDDITYEYIIVESPSARNIIYFDPPLSDWQEARGRLIQMDQAAMDGLGRSDIVITRYAPPRGFHLVVFLSCVLTYAMFFRRSNLEPGSWLYDKVLSSVPEFATFCGTIQPFLFPGMVLLHLGEAAWLDWSRLSKYNVKRGGLLWFTWMVSDFVEGVGAKVRFDRLVDEKKRERENRSY